VDVWVLDVGNGDSTFVRFPSGRTMLVDGGNRTPRQDAGAQVVLPFLRRQGVRQIDVVVGTHPHSDHIGGLVTVLEQVRVGHYLDAGLVDSSWASMRIREVIRRRGIRYTAVCAGDSLAGLGGEAIVLHPGPSFLTQEAPDAHGVNSRSVVIRIALQGRSVLLTGDIERDTDRYLIRWGPRLQADFLKAAHHGSKTSSSRPFLRAVGPTTVAISCGRGNRYGHPSPEVVARLGGMGIRVMRTDRHGAIRARLEPGRLAVSGWLGE
jgi:beta-lactamase superfamily II metal-dependent hydrolase